MSPEPPARQPEMPAPTPELISRAKAFRAAGAAPSPAKPSATVVLARDGAEGLEVFMLRRVAAMAFAGGMHVFPGGAVDPSDLAGRDIEAALVVAAVRETFEETGLLLATGTIADPAALESDRLALIQHEASLDSVCERHNLVVRPEALAPWSHWVTPDFEPRRYDTRFFVAALVDGQLPRHVGGEADAARWVTPAEALAAAARGEWLLMPPTQVTLRELLPFATAAEVFAAAAERGPARWHVDIDLDADPPRFVFRGGQ